tara:strand:+ start:578 stop:865 length:288 start_codon:yes stop_codon:yes gene_type:complete
VAIASLGFNLFLMRHCYKSDSSAAAKSDLVDLKNKELDILKSEFEESKKENNNRMSNIKKEHEEMLSKLNCKIEVFENKSEIDISKIQTKLVNHW